MRSCLHVTVVWDEAEKPWLLDPLLVNREERLSAALGQRVFENARGSVKPAQNSGLGQA